MPGTIDRIKHEARLGKTRKQISQTLKIEYSTLCRYVRNFNIEVASPEMVFGKGRPMFAHDKTKRTRGKNKKDKTRTNTNAKTSESTDALNHIKMIGGLENNFDSLDINIFLKKTWERVNKPITKQDVGID